MEISNNINRGLTRDKCYTIWRCENVLRFILSSFVVAKFLARQ